MRLFTFVKLTTMALLLSTVACSNSGGDEQAGLYLYLSDTPPEVDAVAYEIDCDSGESFSGHFEVLADRDPPIWQAFIGLSQGECQITLIAEDETGKPICTGSTTVTVLAGETVKADITLYCSVDGQDGRGNIDIDGTFRDVVVNQCPIIHFIGAIPSTIPEGSSESDIEVRVSDRDQGPQALSWTISASKGSIADPNAADTVFTCPSVGGGQVEISVVATDGDANCTTSRSITVTCPGVEDLCEGKDCSDGNECTSDVCDPATGACSNPNVADGTACDGGTCQAGACEPSDLCEGKDCSDGNECTSDVCDPATGACSNPNVADGTACDGGSCQAGACEPSDLCEGKDCSDGNACTADVCNPATGACSNPNVADGTACAGGSCQAGVCEPSDLCEGKDCSDANECTADVCAPATGACSNPNQPDGTVCDGGAGSCQAGTCEAEAPPATCDPSGAVVDCAKDFFIADDCALLGNSAAIPLNSLVSPEDAAFSGVPLDVIPQAAIVLPAGLVCGFIGAGFTAVEAANSVINMTVGGATPGNVPIVSHLPTHPHSNVPFDFAAACGTPEGSGPGIVVPFLSAEPGNVDQVTPTGATVDFRIAHSGIALNLANLQGPFLIPALCIGGLCGPAPVRDSCGQEDRDGDGASGGPNDSPRVMYDASCTKSQAALGNCTPFEEFAGVTDVCVGRPPTTAPTVCNDKASCCTALQQLYPTAGAAQQPQIPVN